MSLSLIPARPAACPAARPVDSPVAEGRSVPSATSTQNDDAPGLDGVPGAFARLFDGLVAGKTAVLLARSAGPPDGPGLVQPETAAPDLGLPDLAIPDLPAAVLTSAPFPVAAPALPALFDPQEATAAAGPADIGPQDQFGVQPVLVADPTIPAHHLAGPAAAVTVRPADKAGQPGIGDIQHGHHGPATPGRADAPLTPQGNSAPGRAEPTRPPDISDPSGQTPAEPGKSGQDSPDAASVPTPGAMSVALSVNPRRIDPAQQAGSIPAAASGSLHIGPPLSGPPLIGPTAGQTSAQPAQPTLPAPPRLDLRQNPDATAPGTNALAPALAAAPLQEGPGGAGQSVRPTGKAVELPAAQPRTDENPASRGQTGSSATAAQQVSPAAPLFAAYAAMAKPADGPETAPDPGNATRTKAVAPDPGAKRRAASADPSLPRQEVVDLRGGPVQVAHRATPAVAARSGPIPPTARDAVEPSTITPPAFLTEPQRPDGSIRSADHSSPPGSASRATAAHIATQVAQAAHQQPNGASDITLNPKELGHVRLNLQSIDSTMFVQITAERPETAELMRRHIDSLAQEFRNLGYQDVSFSFAGRQGGSGSYGAPPDPNAGTGDTGDTRNTRPDPGSDIPADRFMPRRTAAQTGGAGLDLRL